MEDLQSSEFEANMTPEELLINNLKLLSYPNPDYPRDFSINLSIDLFRKSNSKAFESIVHFLLSKLLTLEQMQAFIFSWPPRTPDMKREFKDEAFKLLQHLEEQKRLPKGTVVGKSIFDSAQGERAVSLLRTLSEAALKFRLKQDFPWKQLPKMKILEQYMANPSIASRNVICRLKKALLIHIRKEINQFNNSARQAVLQQKTWVQHAGQLTKTHKKLRNEIDQLKQELGQYDQNNTLVNKLSAIDRVPQIDMVRYIWRNIQTLDEQSKERKGSFMLQRIEKEYNGEEAPASIQLDSIDVSVDQVMKKWGVGLKRVAEMLKRKTQEQQQTNQKQILPFLKQVESIVNQNKEDHEDRLSKLREMNSYLQDQIGKVKLSIASHEYKDRQVDQ